MYEFFMKKTTILEYLPELTSQKEKTKEPMKDTSDFIKKGQNILNQQKKLEKTSIQKNLIQIIQEDEKLTDIIKKLGKDWKKNNDGFGYTDKNKITILSTIRDFNANFFKIYKLTDFIILSNENIKINESTRDKSKFTKINDVEYNLYYLTIIKEIFGDKIKIYQHNMLKLLFLRNQNFAALICPKF